MSDPAADRDEHEAFEPTASSRRPKWSIAEILVNALVCLYGVFWWGMGFLMFISLQHSDASAGAVLSKPFWMGLICLLFPLWFPRRLLGGGVIYPLIAGLILFTIGLAL